MRYQVHLASLHNGRTMAHVLEVPGCIAQGASPEEALARVPAAIAEVLDWLRRHGEAAPSPEEPIEVAVASQVLNKRAGEDVIGFFPGEEVPVTADEVPRFLRLMEHSRDELLSVVQGLDEAALEARPGGRGWSIEYILRHVAAAEMWYVTRISGRGALPRLKPRRIIWDRLEAVRHQVVGRLQGLTLEERSRVVVREGERWSARKVFRRYLEHEREHLGHIREVLGRLRGEGS